MGKLDFLDYLVTQINNRIDTMEQSYNNHISLSVNNTHMFESTNKRMITQNEKCHKKRK